MRVAEYREGVIRATAAAYATAEVFTLIRQALTRRSARRERRARARG